MSQVLRSIQKKWMSLIRKAQEDKWDKFGKAAAESMMFYGSDDHSFIFRREYASSSGLRVKGADDSAGGDGAGLTFEATANLVSNVVSVFLPVLYHRNPVRTISPRKPNINSDLLARYRQMQIQKTLMMASQTMGLDPAMMMQAEQGIMNAMQQMQMQTEETTVTDKLRASLLEWYMNYTPKELNLKDRARDAIIEAIVKGMGLLWVSIDDSGERRVTGLEYDSVDHLFIDPDAERLEDAKWIARRKRRPVWEVEREFGLEPGTIKATDVSVESEAEAECTDEFERAFDAQEGKTSDLIVYYEIWSRMGVGQRITGGFDEDLDKSVIDTLEQFGDYAYVVVSPSHEIPLNLPEEVVNQEDQAQAGAEVVERLKWPAEFYKHRSNPWPFAALSFRRVPRKVWPQSYIHPAMGYQKCINWILSFLMARVKITSRAFIVVPRGVEDEIKNAILSGKDLTLLEINSQHAGTMDQLVQFVKMPEENANIWTLLSALKREFEDATGVTELNLSGRSSTQMRSAAEADLKRDVLSVRPDDMANEVDSWMSDAAFLEAIAARSLLTADDVAPVFGEKPAEGEDGSGLGEFTRLWVELVQTTDTDRIVSEFEYGVESGSARKPNRAQEIQNIDEGSQLILQQFIQVWTTTGDPTKFNTWIEMWAKSRDFADYEAMFLPDMSEFIQQQQAMQMGMMGPQMPPEGEMPPEGMMPPDQQMQQMPPQGPPQ